MKKIVEAKEYKRGNGWSVEVTLNSGKTLLLIEDVKNGEYQRDCRIPRKLTRSLKGVKSLIGMNLNEALNEFDAFIICYL